MSQWVWLVKHTAEHTPGPWAVTLTREDGGDYAVVSTSDAGAPLTFVCHMEHTGQWSKANGDKYAAAIDPEAAANARLVADAPLMLSLLARMAELCIDCLGPLDEAVGEAHRLAQEVPDLLRRHVRIGCAPVDAEMRQPSPADDLLIDRRKYDYLKDE